MDEKEAIIRLKNGDIDALAVLVEQYQVKAVRTANFITQDRALAEDIVQSAFIRVYRKIHQFDDSQPFAPWFMRIVANDAVKSAKRQQRTVSLDATAGESEVSFVDLLPDDAPSPDHQLEDHELKQSIRTALKQLSPSQRKAVVLRYFLGFSEKEMADEMDVPRGTVKWRLSAARKYLSAILPEGVR